MGKKVQKKEKKEEIIDKKCKVCGSICLSEDRLYIKCNNCGFIEIKQRGINVKKVDKDVVMLI